MGRLNVKVPQGKPGGFTACYGRLQGQHIESVRVSSFSQLRGWGRATRDEWRAPRTLPTWGLTANPKRDLGQPDSGFPPVPEYSTKSALSRLQSNGKRTPHAEPHHDGRADVSQRRHFSGARK